MRCKFLRDYHGPETDEHRYLEGEVVVLSDAVVKNFAERKIVIALEEEKESRDEFLKTVFPMSMSKESIANYKEVGGYSELKLSPESDSIEVITPIKKAIIKRNHKKR